MMKKLAILILAIAFLTSCSHQGKKETSQKSVKSQSATSDSTLFSIKGQSFSATLTTAKPFITAKVQMDTIGNGANGPFPWQITNSLSNILTSLYNGKVKLLNSPYAGRHYSLKIEWQGQTSFGKVRRKVANKMKQTFGYTVQTKTRRGPKYILSVKSYSALKNPRDIPAVIDTTGVTATTYLNNSWKIYGPLSKLVEVINEKTDYTVALKKDYGSKAYYFELNASHGIKGLINQLEGNYGLAFRKKMVPVKHYIIKF